MSIDSTKKTLAYAAITITASLLVSLGITITFNYTYVNQQFTNIYSTLTSIQEQISEIPKEPVVVNVTVPLPNVTEPTPIPVPPPKPTCDTDEFYNATLNECTAKPIPVPPPKPTCTAEQVYNPTTNKCDPKPAPPVPTTKPFTFTVVGDIDNSNAGTNVFNTIKSQNATFDFVLGDLGYDDDLDWFKSTYGTLGDKMYCVIGNHEADNEDGSASIEKEAKNYCGDSYWFRYYNNLFLFFNTNGDLNIQSTKAIALLKNVTVIKDVKNIFVLSHKPCEAAPNSHHEVESSVKTFCDKIKSAIPTTINSIYISAHNHVYSESADKKYITIGAGGRSHYTCGTNTSFPICDNTHYGFLKLYVTTEGKVASQFIDYNGKVIH
jgi:hypothetical protein